MADKKEILERIKQLKQQVRSKRFREEGESIKIIKKDGKKVEDS